MARLTPKQEQFAATYIETGNASAAYRKAYNAAKMKANTVSREAFALLENPKIAARVAELQADAQARHKTTVDSLIKELEEARTVAKGQLSASSMVQATMGKARLLGLDKPDIGAGEDLPAPEKVLVEVQDASADAET